MRHHRLLLPVVVPLLSLALLSGCCPSLARTGQRALATIAVAAGPTATREPTATPEPTLPPPEPPTVTPEPTEEPTAEPEATAPPAEEVGLPEGWVRHERPADGFSVALPRTWRVLDLDPDSLKSFFEAMTELNPQLAPLLQGQAQSLAASGCKLWALDLDPAAISSGTSASMVVVKQAQTAKLPLDLLVQVVIGQLENVEGIEKPIRHRPATVDGYEAEELQIGLDVNAPDGSVKHAHELEYVLFRDKVLYGITLSAAADRTEDYAPVFEQIMESFSFTEP